MSNYNPNLNLKLHGNTSDFHSNMDEIYYGSRKDDFKTLIAGIVDLLSPKIKKEYIAVLKDKKSMNLFSQAFTAASACPTVNYEIFEQLGDLVANKFIVSYSYRRFPQLWRPEGVKVVARLRINYGSKRTFSQIAERLGFWKFISATVDDRQRRKKDLLEDCLEAVVGVVEYIMDTRFVLGCGNQIAYELLSAIFDDIDISLKYEDLYDAKTRIKELCDKYKSELGTIKYENNLAQDAEGKSLKVSSLYLFTSPSSKKKFGFRDKVLIGKHTAYKKSDAQQKAASQGISLLNKKGFVKDPPQEYLIFSNAIQI